MIITSNIRASLFIHAIETLQKCVDLPEYINALNESNNEFDIMCAIVNYATCEDDEPTDDDDERTKQRVVECCKRHSIKCDDALINRVVDLICR